jgi:xylulokinase
MARRARVVAGIDSSTQATKVVVRDADTGGLIREGRAPHPTPHVRQAYAAARDRPD